VPADPPPEVQITVTVVPHSRGPRLRELSRCIRPGRALRLLVPGAVALAVLAAAVLATMTSAGRSGAPTARATAAERAAVAAAFGYPYPLRCLAITFYGAFARAHVDRTGACAQYRGYLNGTFHLIDGHWRLVLDEGQLFVPNALLVGAR
jgi:hypothetical protein